MILEKIELITAIFANVATILGASSVFIAIIVIFKNRFSTSKVHLSINHQVRGSFWLNISNHTNKEFSILEIILETKNQCFSAKQIVNNDSIKLQNIHINPYESLEVLCNFSVKEKLLQSKTFKFVLLTTQGTLSYKTKKNNGTYTTKNTNRTHRQTS